VTRLIVKTAPPSYRGRMRAGLFLCALTVIGCETYAERVNREHTVESVSSARIDKSDPPVDCVPVGAIEGRGMSYERARADAQMKAEDKGANWVTLDTARVPANVLSETILHARVFRCPRRVVTPPAEVAAPEPAPASRPVVAAACEPDCSPPYVCLRGSCVEACNPRCQAPKVCGADRICHAE
jgi:hypothetical protein